MLDCQYVFAPWEKVDGVWTPPSGAIGLLDFAKSEDYSSEQRVGFFAIDPNYTSDGVLLAKGDCREIHANERIRNIFKEFTGFRPSGAFLSDLLFDALTAGSDPVGGDRVRSLMPNNNRELEVWFANRKICKRKLKGDLSKGHGNRIRDILRQEIKEVIDDGESNFFARNKWRKVWGARLLQFPDVDPNTLIPDCLRHELPLQPETTYTDDFSGTLSNWAASSPDVSWSISSGSLIATGTDVGIIRYLSALSSSDNWTDMDASAVGPACRCNNSNSDCYCVRIAGGFGVLSIIASGVSSTLTFGSIGTNRTGVKAIGSTITLRATDADTAFVVTNTTVSTGVYCGSSLLLASGSGDNWTATDGIGSGPALPVLFHHYRQQGIC